MNAKPQSALAAALLARVEEQLKQQIPASLDKVKLLAGVSGGVDSVVMLDILHELQASSGFALAVAHFNHELRPAAATDEAFVREITKKYSLEYFVSSGNVRRVAREKKISIETAARAIRYDFFRETLAQTGFGALATAHTMNDNEETVLLNLLRGAGLAGLAGIPPSRQFDAARIVRPMLLVSRREIVEYARIKRLAWREDESNLMTEFRRNYVRAEVAPLLARVNPRHAEAVSRAARIVRSLLEYLRPQIDEARRALALNAGVGSLSIAIAPLKEYFNILTLFALQDLIADAFGGLTLSFDGVENIVRLADRQPGARLTIAQSVMAMRGREEIVFSARRRATPAARTFRAEGSCAMDGAIVSVKEVPLSAVAIGGTRAREYVDADKAGGEFTLRPWTPGDSFIPLGKSSRRKVSDYLTDKKIDPATKKDVLVLESKEQIIWLCGVQLDNRVRVTANTKRVLELSISL